MTYTPHLISWSDLKADCQYDHDNDGYIFGLHWEDQDGQIVDAEWFKTEDDREYYLTPTEAT